MKKCSLCEHWDPAQDQLAGLCRAEPARFNTQLSCSRGLWPETGKDDWCAWFKQKTPTAPHLDKRPGVAMVDIDDNGIVAVTHHNGDQFELAALEGLSEADKRAIERMVWMPEQ